MTNEEKAIELSLRNGAYDASLEMAEWKDEQFKEYLEQKILFLESQRKSWNKASNRYIAFGIAILNLQSIIDELFKENNR